MSPEFDWQRSLFPSMLSEPRLAEQFSNVSENLERSGKVLQIGFTDSQKSQRKHHAHSADIGAAKV